MSTTDWESGDEDVEVVSGDEGEEDVPPGSADDVGGGGEGMGGSEAAVGGSLGDLGGGGWTESGGHTESGAEVGSGMPSGAGDLGSESADPGLGGGMGGEDTHDRL